MFNGIEPYTDYILGVSNCWQVKQGSEKG